MNETNIKHGYNLMVRDARHAILNPGAQISKERAEFIQPGMQYWGPPGAGFFLTMLAPWAGPRPTIVKARDNSLFQIVHETHAAEVEIDAYLGYISTIFIRTIF